KRVPAVLHQGTGVYLMRMPGIGSDKGIAHVTPGWWGVPASCVVRSTERAEVDELILVACFDSFGALKDTNFHLSFGAPSVSGMPMPAIRYDVPDGAASADPRNNSATANNTGGAIRVERLERGRYRAIVGGKGFTANGYAQITPLGNKPVWC